jgi:hypothetical protein
MHETKLRRNGEGKNQEPRNKIKENELWIAILSKRKITNYKHQITYKLQNPNPKFQN